MTTPIYLRQHRPHVTRYRDLLLVDYRGGNSYYTERGMRVMRFIGDCIASGGAVNMETRYVDGQSRVRADVTLIWGPNSANNARRVGGQHRTDD